jgi:hypothetical protein
MGVNWATGLMSWKPHVSPSGRVHLFHHLHPFRFTLVLSGSSGSDDIEIDVEVGFAMHTFTRSRCESDVHGSSYTDKRERRTFDGERYLLSHRLPEIISSLSSRKCYHARNQNYLSVDDISSAQRSSEYRVFFVLRRWTSRHSEPRRPCVRLIVQSAYATPKSSRGKEKPISFRILLYRALGIVTGPKSGSPARMRGPVHRNLLVIPLLVRTPEGADERRAG